MIPNTLTDIAILALPIYYIRGLYTSSLNRILLTGIFMTGAMYVVFSSLSKST